MTAPSASKHRCNITGCTRPGTHHLVAKVWAVGYPKSSAPISSVIGMMFCKDHAHEQAASQNVIGEEFWQAVNSITSARRLLPVDPASLELKAIRGDAFASIDSMRKTH